MLKKHIAKIFAVLTCLVFLMPLVVWPNSNFPFITLKAFWLQATAAIAFAFYLAVALFRWREYRPRFSWLGLAVLLFYAAIFVSAILGVDFWRSFWGRYERMTGVFQMLHFGVLFLVWRSVLSKEEWDWLWRRLTGVVGALVLLAGAYQVVNPKFLINLGAERVGATLGNPIFVATFSLMILFSALIFWRRSVGWAKWAWLAEVVLSLFVVFASQTRGALVGLWVGVIFLCAGFAFGKTNEGKYKKYYLGGLLFLFAAPVLLLAISGFAWANKLPGGIGRLSATASNVISGAGPRLIFWQTAIDAWRERPLFGWGWENFYDAANKYYSVNLLKFGLGEEWTDNAHNVFFNTLTTMGLFGLLAWLLVYFFIYFSLFKKYREKSPDEKFFSLCLGALFATHFVQNLFAFDNPASYLFFFWLLAGVEVWFNRTSVAPEFKKAAANLLHPLWQKIIFILLKVLRAAAVVALAVGLIVLLNRFTYLPCKADRLSALAIKAAMTDFGGAIKLHKQAIDVQPNPYSTDFAFLFGRFFIMWLHAHPDFPFTDYRQLAVNMYGLGEDAIRYYLTIYPDDAWAQSTLALAYQDGYEFWQNPAYLSAAAAEYQKAIALSPGRQTLWFGLARVKTMMGEYKEAIQAARWAVNLAPDVAISHWNLSLALAKVDPKQSYAEARRAIDFGYALNTKEMIYAFQLFDGYDRAGVLEPRVIELFALHEKYVDRLAQLYSEWLARHDRGHDAEQVRKLFAQ